jgi:hypothetical protein
VRLQEDPVHFDLICDDLPRRIEPRDVLHLRNFV